jgi:cell division protein FtsZ
VTGEKIQLGRTLTKGLGAGGDPDLGQQAVMEAEEEIRASLRDRRIVFLCVGLGGGTGSGAAPVITRIAREEGAFVVVFATMPFEFEGRRRREQAETALNELAVLSNALVTFDNNRMGELVLAKQGVHEAFSAADRMVCESIKAVIRLVVRPGLINVGLDDLMSALRTNRSRCLFGSGIAKGKDRATAALRNALSSPLLDQGALLKQAQTVLVHLCGGEDLTLFEVELLMRGLQKYVPAGAHVLFGAAIDPSLADNLSVTLISALPEDALSAAGRDGAADVRSELLDPSDTFAEVPPVSEPVRPSAEPKPVRAVHTFVPPPPAEEYPAADEGPAPFLPEDEEDLGYREAGFEAAGPDSYLPDPPAPEAEARVSPPQEPLASEELPPARKIGPFSFKAVSRHAGPPKKLWEKGGAQPEARPAAGAPEPFAAAPEPAPAPPPPAETPAEVPAAVKLKLGVKTTGTQDELAFDSAPRGRFEGQTNVVDGEDLDLPPFLRKKK